jgi:hypothetical protein
MAAADYITPRSLTGLRLPMERLSDTKYTTPAMSTDPSSRATASDDFFRDVNRLTTTAVAYWTGVLVSAAVLIFLWFDVKPGPIYGLLVTVPAGERVLHRMLGVDVFDWLLARSGYNRRVVHLSCFISTRCCSNAPSCFDSNRCCVTPARPLPFQRSCHDEEPPKTA